MSQEVNEVYFWHADKHRSFLQVDTAKFPKIRSLVIFAISPEKSGMKLIFCLQINTKIFYKLIVPLWLCIARHVQSIQNNTFAISLKYMKENVKDVVDFLPADKHQRFLQIDTIILGLCGGMPKLPRTTSLLFLCNVLRKK